MQDWLPAGWLAFAGRESNPLDRYERFQLSLHRIPLSKAYPDASWAHARRKFDEALKLNKQDLVSTRILVQMAKLFALDAQARDENMDHARRHALRMERAPSVFTELVLPQTC